MFNKRAMQLPTSKIHNDVSSCFNVKVLGLTHIIQTMLGLYQLRKTSKNAMYTCNSV